MKEQNKAASGRPAACRRKGLRRLLGSRSLLSFLLAMAVMAGLIALGGLLPHRGAALWRAVWIGCCGAILLCYLANALFLLVIGKRFDNNNLAEAHRMLQSKQQSVERDLAGAIARLNRSIRLAYVWYFFVLALCCAVMLLTVPGNVPVWVLVPDTYILWGLVGVWLRRQPQEEPELSLSREQYPVIWELVDRAAAASGCSMPVRIFGGGSSVGIVRRPKELWIQLDAIIVALFTKSELYHALLHEFAHERNADTAQTLRIERELARWDNDADSLAAAGTFLLSLSQGMIAMEYAFYELFVTKHREALADEGAADRGSAQELVNGLAKLSVWSIFENNTPVPELTPYAEYASEQPPTDLPARALGVFRALLPQMREQWRHRLDVELPPRVSSHPIFRQRREAFGVTDYSFETLETDEAYLAEAQALLDQTGRAIAGQIAETYDRDRKVQYLERKQRIDRAKAVRDWSALSIDERIELAQALTVVEPELQETAIQSILAQEPENSYGIMLLGEKRFRENDPACVELLKKAAALNFNFVEQAYELLGDYALSSGDQALLDEYRAKVADAVQSSRDTEQTLGVRWKGKERLFENDLPAEQFAANRDAIIERTEGKLARLYSVRSESPQGPCYSYFLEFREGLDPEERERLYDQVFLYLDYLPTEEYYSLADLTGAPKRIAYLLRRVPGCEIPLQKHA